MTGEQNNSPPALPYGLSKEWVDAISNALDVKDYGTIIAQVKSLHPADMADLIESLSTPRQDALIDLLRGQLDPEIFSELDDYSRDRVFHHLTPQEMAAAISDLESDDAVQLIADLDDDQRRDVLEAVSPEDRAHLNESLRFPENSAGRLMQREYVTSLDHLTIGEFMDTVFSAPCLPDYFFDVFIVDPQNNLLGFVPLNQLLRHPHQTPLVDIMVVDHIRVPVDMDKEEVAFLFQKYGLTSVGVVNHDDKLMGMITVDDAMIVMQEATTADLMRLGRVSNDDFHAPILEISWNRFRWLFVTFINTLIASSVIYQFQGTLENYIALAVLMPIVASMGGNAGMQVVTVIVRAISDRELQLTNLPKLLGREVTITLLNSIIFASFLASIAALWYHDLSLGLVLGCAMIFNITWSGIAGTLLPITLHRYGMDPAISAGPILTTTTDVFGFTVFLGLATVFLM